MTQAAQALDRIEAAGSRKLAGDLANRAPGLALATSALHTELQALAAPYPLTAICLACLIWRAVAQCPKRSAPWQRNESLRLLAGAFAPLQALLGADTDTVLETVKGLLQRRYRASSALEGFNAPLRPFLYVHKGVTQSFLELFRAHYNLRTRRWGRHQGTSAPECLTGIRVTDGLSLLGYPPSGRLH